MTTKPASKSRRLTLAITELLSAVEAHGHNASATLAATLHRLSKPELVVCILSSLDQDRRSLDSIKKSRDQYGKVLAQRDRYYLDAIAAQAMTEQWREIVLGKIDIDDAAKTAKRFAEDQIIATAALRSVISKSLFPEQLPPNDFSVAIVVERSMRKGYIKETKKSESTRNSTNAKKLRAQFTKNEAVALRARYPHLGVEGIHKRYMPEVNYPMPDGSIKRRKIASLNTFKRRLKEGRETGSIT